ncbi:MAG: HAD hydrolase-like protein [Anaerolineae bacterium]|nr:HAD hydrolase-like protein [Anaerolineae bacterium]
MLTLLIDADDTLWENNIFYEACLDDFATLMAEQGFDRDEAEQTADRVERERIPQVGYAVEEFARSLVIAYQRLCERHRRPFSDDVAATAMDIGRRPAEYPIELLEGVEKTLGRLSGRFRLHLLTKGDPAVQEDKLARSGLGEFFDEVHVVPEKDAAVFRRLIAQYDLQPERTWMVGNSPRSDINPAVEAGISAVYVPHPNTWELEVEQVVDSERVTVLRRFGDVARFFSSRESLD